MIKLNSVIIGLCLSLAAFSIVYGQQQENYPVHPDSIEQPGVPKGEVLKFTFENSKIFPGTWREYWVYVPAQYSPDKPACVYVNQDGVQWNAPIVFDNLIHKKDMPITIGVFVMHGKVRSANESTALDRFNRSYEYDNASDNYVRFLLEELLPDVETRKTSDGRQIRLSKNGNDRAIGGSSSGAICAFTAAWERPDEFTRVFSAIGTYVGLRGGDRYTTFIRKYEPKSIRIFLQDGSNDHNIYAGDWWMANQSIERSLIFAGYEIEHVWGEGAHNGKHGTAIFPEAMRMLWKNWPEPVKAGKSRNGTLNTILVPGEGWELAPDGFNFKDRTSLKTFNGNKYHLAKNNAWLTKPNGEKKQVETGFRQAVGIAVSPDQTMLYIADRDSHWIYSAQIQADGTLRYSQRFYQLHAREMDDVTGATSICLDTEGRLYAATNMGIQICDQTGRVQAIIPTPNGIVTDIAFGGAELDVIYVGCGDKIYKRKIKAKGANISNAPIKPEKPRL